jgi:hypothetical protein
MSITALALAALVHAQTPEAAPPPPPPAPPAPMPEKKEPPPPGIDAGWNKGFFLQSHDGVFKLKIGALMQPRLEIQGSDPDLSTLKTRAAIQRAQFELGGSAFSKDLTYFLKVEMGQGFTFVKDAYFNYQFIPEVLELRVGQFKRPFSREQLSSDWKLGFVDRAETDTFFKGSRDVGVAVHNDIDKSRTIEWSAGVFAGQSEKPAFSGDVVPSKKDPSELVIDGVKESSVVSPLAPTGVVRLGYNLGDLKGYNALDMDGGGLRFGVAGSALETVEPVAGGSRGATRGEVDAIVKLAGFDATVAWYASAKQKKGEQSFVQDYEAMGVQAQAGYLIADFVHPAFRWCMIQQADDTTLHELTGALTFLVFGQNVAVQVDGTAFLNNGDPARPAQELRTRAQLNLAF